MKKLREKINSKITELEKVITENTNEKDFESARSNRAIIHGLKIALTYITDEN